jgi:hypothetical protein
LRPQIGSSLHRDAAFGNQRAAYLEGGRTKASLAENRKRRIVVQAFIQPQAVKNASISPKVNVTQATPAPRAPATPTTGTRFLGFLMSALGAFAA